MRSCIGSVSLDVSIKSFGMAGKRDGERVCGMWGGKREKEDEGTDGGFASQRLEADRLRSVARCACSPPGILSMRGGERNAELQVCAQPRP